MKNKPKIAIVGAGSIGKTILTAAITDFLQVESLKQKTIQELQEEEKVFTIKNYRVNPLIPISLHEDKPSNNALKRCAKGMHLYNSENECVICNKSIKL